MNQGEDYENMIIKSNADGSMLRLKDVARVEFGSYTYSTNARMDGNPRIGFCRVQTAGSNANDILKEVERLLEGF
jgi:multidrug efflux pump subunit AcrB